MQHPASTTLSLPFDFGPPLRWTNVINAAVLLVVGGGFVIVLARIGDLEAPWVVFSLSAFALLAFSRLRKPLPKMWRLDSKGLRLTTGGPVVVAWSALRGASVAHRNGESYICLELRDREQWFRRRRSSLLSPALEHDEDRVCPDLALNLTGMDVDAATLASLINSHLADIDSPAY